MTGNLFISRMSVRTKYCFLWGPYRQNKKKLNYSLDSDENLHTYVKSNIKWGNRHKLFTIFFIENDLFTENVKKGSAVTNLTVERFNIHI